jgi:hypothetical protein
VLWRAVETYPVDLDVAVHLAGLSEGRGKLMSVALRLALRHRFEVARECPLLGAVRLAHLLAGVAAPGTIRRSTD